MPDRCPRHLSQPYDDCPLCEALIRRAELALNDTAGDDGWQDGQDAYERWLGRSAER